MAHLSRARTLIDPLFSGFFFQGHFAILLSREARMLQGRREVRLLRLSLVRQTDARVTELRKALPDLKFDLFSTVRSQFSLVSLDFPWFFEG